MLYVARLFIEADSAYLEHVADMVEISDMPNYQVSGRTIYYYLTKEEYERQLNLPNNTWAMPELGIFEGVNFDDLFYEELRNGPK